VAASWQDLVTESGFSHSYQSVKRFINKLSPPAAPQARVVIVTVRFSVWTGYREMLKDRFIVWQLAVESGGISLVRLLANEQFVPRLPTLILLLSSRVKLTLPAQVIAKSGGLFCEAIRQ
jgi:hypothetical protein